MPPSGCASAFIVDHQLSQGDFHMQFKDYPALCGICNGIAAESQDAIETHYNELTVTATALADAAEAALKEAYPDESGLGWFDLGYRASEEGFELPPVVHQFLEEEVL
jgi:hypothetical protein